MISLSEARARIAAATHSLDPLRVPLAQAHGCVLREEIAAPEDFPAFDRSAMDGYAVAADDASERFTVIGEVQPGGVPAVVVGRGQCVRIFTGAQIPEGASRVFMQEDVRREGDAIFVLRRDQRGHIRHRGEDARCGDILLRPGMRLGAGEASLLAQIGVTEPQVSPEPRVIHCTTGNELVAPIEQPGPGQIRDSNSTLIAALLAESGARLMTQRRCGDALETLTQIIRDEPESGWDVLLISGGASVGDYDFGRRALEALGFQVVFDRINLRPGKPLIFGTRGRQIAFVIPGNPVSHFVVFHVAIRLAIERLLGAAPEWPLADLTLTEALPAQSDPRETYWPARVEWQAGQLVGRPLAWQSSGDLRGLVGANALLQMLPGSAGIAAGERACGLLLVGRG